MKVEIRLKKLLQEYDLDHHGIKQQIADDLELNRHTVAKIYNQEAPTISLDVLSRLCTWLQNQGIPADELPAGLFSTGRSKLWETIAEKKKVTLYLGEGRQTQEPAAAYRWISRRDSMVATVFVAQLSRGGEDGYQTPYLEFKYVPFRYGWADYDPGDEPTREDIDRVEKIFQEMRADSINGTNILIGSQRVNYLLECYISYLFGCRPFVPLTDQPRVPFYLVWREGDQKIPSCFGGATNPFRSRDATVPGVHYLDKGRWLTCPWKEQKKDAGVIVTTYEPKNKAVEIALFGFSGRATEAIGKQIMEKEHLFWPPAVAIRGKEIGIYICKLEFSAKKPLDSTGENLLTKNCEVTPLSEKTLKKYLR